MICQTKVYHTRPGKLSGRFCFIADRIMSIGQINSKIMVVMETLMLERYIRDAQLAFKLKDFQEGRRLLEEALSIEPVFGKAHTLLGWLYLFQINDWEKAEIHLKLALKYAPSYSTPYLHMSYILFEKGRFKELTGLLDKALTVGGVSKALIYNNYGRMFEADGQFRKAVRFYKTAIQWAFSEEELQMIKTNIKRCRDKRWVLLL